MMGRSGIGRCRRDYAFHFVTQLGGWWAVDATRASPSLACISRVSSQACHSITQSIIQVLTTTVHHHTSKQPKTEHISAQSLHLFGPHSHHPCNNTTRARTSSHASSRQSTPSKCATARLLHHFTFTNEERPTEQEREMAAAGNSRFAVTCGLLRQYMRRDSQQLGALDAALRLPPLVEAVEEAEEEETDGRTMQLFPTRAGTGTSSSSFQPFQQERPPEAKQLKGPLTIVYDGRVVVLEDFPADKAKELMQMAGSACSPAPSNGAPAVAQKPAAAAQTQPPSSAVPSSDLPIARKVSLKWFLQKRKERIGAIEPYPKVTATSAAAEKDVPAAGKTVTTTVKDRPAASWLGL